MPEVWRCCTRYRIPLRAFEYTSLLETFGSWCVQVAEGGKLFLRRIGGRCVFYDGSGTCTLQKLGMKPLACKLWPLAVYSHARTSRRRRDGSLEYRGQTYYIYVNRACNGVNRGDPRYLEKTVKEPGDISLEPSRHQEYSTFSLGSLNFVGSGRGVAEAQ